MSAKFQYEICCVNSTAELIDAMTERAKPISLRTFKSRTDWRIWAEGADFTVYVHRFDALSVETAIIYPGELGHDVYFFEAEWPNEGSRFRTGTIEKRRCFGRFRSLAEANARRDQVRECLAQHVAATADLRQQLKTANRGKITAARGLLRESREGTAAREEGV